MFSVYFFRVAWYLRGIIQNILKPPLVCDQQWTDAFVCFDLKRLKFQLLRCHFEYDAAVHSGGPVDTTGNNIFEIRRVEWHAEPSKIPGEPKKVHTFENS